jgi:hypothetical protein
MTSEFVEVTIRSDCANTEEVLMSSYDSLEKLMTPETMVCVQSRCKVVGNKQQSVLYDESQHSKWEDFRRLAKIASLVEECSILLRRMEMQELDEEEGEMEHEEQ